MRWAQLGLVSVEHGFWVQMSPGEDPERAKALELAELWGGRFGP